MSDLWSEVRLGNVIREEREPINTFDGSGLPVLGVTNHAGVTQTGIQASEDKSKYLRLRPNRFVYNPYRVNVGSLGLTSPAEEGITSPAYVVFRTTDNLDPHFLYYFLTSRRGNQLINFHGNRGSVRAALRFADLCRIELPLPPMDEQRRIVARIEELATKLSEARALRSAVNNVLERVRFAVAGQILSALEEQFPLARLGDCVEIRGGGTPSKSNPFFWQGEVPWVSPKDMKVREIFDSLDHISLQAARETSAKLIDPGAVLVVVRGMILSHTVPVAVLRVPATINQDMKALIPRHGIDPEFLSAFLWSHNQRLLGLVEKSTHDTRKLETNRLLGIEIPLPPVEEQRRVVAAINLAEGKVAAVQSLQAETVSELDSLLPAILDRAFRGEL